jgi:hypothetical protein
MLRFLLILTLSVYIISKIGSWFFRAGVSAQQNRNPRKPNDGNVNVDGKVRKDRKNGGIKGGEYVDYEEVK